MGRRQAVVVALLGLLIATTPAAAAVPAHGRAWELATPQETLGIQPLQIRAWNSNGDRVAYASFGPMPGAVSGEVLAHTTAVRTATGWTNQPVGQPFTVHAAQLLATVGLAVDQSVSTWLWGSLVPLTPDGPERETSLYRRAPDGTLTLLGSIGEGGFLEGLPAASADVEHAAFESFASLLPNDSGRIEGRAVYDVAGTDLRFTGVDSTGDPLSPCGSVLGNGTFAPAPNMMSSDGSRIFLASPDPITSACGASSVYLREGLTTTRISASHCTRPDCGPPAAVTFAGAPPDGSSAFLATSQQLTDDDTDDGLDLYRYTVSSGALARLSRGPAGVVANLAPPVLSAEHGGRVYFVAGGELVAGEGTPGAGNLYLRQGTETRFVATLGDGETLGTAATSADGHVLLFASTANLLPGDLDGESDVYLYDAETDALTRVSVGAHGEGNGPFAATIGGAVKIEPLTGHQMLNLSADGEHAFIQTSEALAPGDVNETLDVYEWAAGSLGLVSSGTGIDNDLAFNGVSADGRNAFLLTRQSLLPADSDGGELDLYAARLGGGFPEAAPPSPCESEVCQGALPTRLQRADPASPLQRAESRRGAPPRQSTFQLAALDAAARRSLVRTGHAVLVVRVPAPGQIGVTGSAEIDGKRQIVVRTSAIAWEAGRVRVPLRLGEAARRVLAPQGSLLRVRLVARYSRSPRQRTLILVLRGKS